MTIAARLKARATARVTANSEVHMAYLLIGVDRAGKFGQANARALVEFPGSYAVSMHCGEEAVPHTVKICANRS
jgi:hypothetical protein